MRSIFALAVILASTGAALAQYGTRSNSLYGSSNSLTGTGSNPSNHYTNSYTKHDGTTVNGHYQTNPNNTQLDNYGTRGNYNPNTGTYGTRSPR